MHTNPRALLLAFTHAPAGTKEFFKGLADITGGRYLALVCFLTPVTIPALNTSSAHKSLSAPQVNAELLPDIIVGGAEEEAALRRLEAAVAAEADVIRQQIQSRDPAEGGAAADIHSDDEEAIYSMASAAVMSKRKTAIPQFNLSQQADIPLSRHVESAATLAEAKVLLPLASP